MAFPFCRLFFLVIVGLLACCRLSAQKMLPWAGWAFEPGIHYGAGIKHSPKFRAPIKGAIWGGELNISRQTTGNKSWEAVHRRPDLGVAFSYMHIANPNVYGDAYGILPNITFGPKSNRRVYAHFRLGVGLAWLTRPYHPIDNANNRVIGSHLNNITSIRFGLGVRCSAKMRIHGSFCFTHYSNGGAQLPNLGINVVSGLLGIYYTPQPYQADMLRPDSLPRPRERSHRWHGVATIGIGNTERTTPGGPKYAMPSASVEVSRFLNPVNRLGLGFLWEYNIGWQRFLEYTQLGTGISSAAQRLEAQRFALYLSDEIFFGKLSLNFQAGVYFVQAKKKPAPYFARLGIRYYLRRPDGPGFKPHLGVYLKAHSTVAEYVAFGVGGAF